MSELIDGVSLGNDCAHYWVIESPNGPTSVGACKHCGAVREFKNSIHITSWESDSHHVHRSPRLAASSGI